MQNLLKVLQNLFLAQKITTTWLTMNAGSSMSERMILYFDGLCEPRNPGGVATYGYAIYKGSSKVSDGYGTVGAGMLGNDVSNNVAEYTAMIKGMDALLSMGHTAHITVKGDSQLTIRQMQGKYAVHAKRLAPLHAEARRTAKRFDSVEFQWIPREENEEADALSRAAFDAFLKEHRAEYKLFYRK